MYSSSAEVAQHWRALLSLIIAHAGVDIEWLEHLPPTPIEQLWSRPDLGAVLMCGLPFSRACPQPVLVAAPVPLSVGRAAQARYWSELVVAADSGLFGIEDAFGRRIAFTTPESQSGFAAVLVEWMKIGAAGPLFEEVIAPQITPRGALSAVVDGRADIAPIDSYAFSLLQAYEPELTARVRVIARTTPTASPALVASAAVPELAAACVEAHRISAIQPLMGKLLLERFVVPGVEPYNRLRVDFEAALSYWRGHRFAATTHPVFASLLDHR